MAFGPHILNILLLGSDRRSGTAFRDDVLILVSVDPVERRAVVLSIPRDLWVYLPGQGMQRINSAFLIGEERDYAGGGMGLLKDALMYNFGIPVHRYIRVEMQAFERLIDALGGVDVLVACAYTDWRLESPDAPPDQRESWELFTVSPGRTAMDGDLALWYARARAHSSDFDRSRRQQEVLRALSRISQQPSVLARIPWMYQALASHVSTDLTLAEVLELARLAAELDPASVRSRFIGRDQVDNYRVPGSGAAVLLPRPDALRALLEATFAGDARVPETPLVGLEIELVDASGRPGWAELAAERLAYAGVTTVPADSQVQSDDRTVLQDAQPGNDPTRQALLQVLGLRQADVQAAPRPEAPLRFRLVVGKDYNPCFDPTRRQAASDG